MHPDDQARLARDLSDYAARCLIAERLDAGARYYADRVADCRYLAANIGRVLTVLWVQEHADVLAMRDLASRCSDEPNEVARCFALARAWQMHRSEAGVPARGLPDGIRPAVLEEYVAWLEEFCDQGGAFTHCYEADFPEYTVFVAVHELQIDPGRFRGLVVIVPDGIEVSAPHGIDAGTFLFADHRINVLGNVKYRSGPLPGYADPGLADIVGECGCPSLAR